MANERSSQANNQGVLNTPVSAGKGQIHNAQIKGKSLEITIHLYCYPSKMGTLHGTNISHLGKRKIIFKMPFLRDISFLEGNLMTPTSYQGFTGNFPPAELPLTLGPAAKAATMAASAAAATAASAASSWSCREIRGKGGEKTWKNRV